MAQRTAEIGAARNEVQRLTYERDATRRELASATAALETVTKARAVLSRTTDKAAAKSAGLALLDTEVGMTPSRTSLTSEAQPSLRLALAQAGGEPSFFVQLVAFRSKSGALSEIGRLQVVFPDNMDLAALIVSSGEASEGLSVFRIMTEFHASGRCGAPLQPVVDRHGELRAESSSLTFRRAAIMALTISSERAGVKRQSVLNDSTRYSQLPAARALERSPPYS